FGSECKIDILPNGFKEEPDFVNFGIMKNKFDFLQNYNIIFALKIIFLFMNYNKPLDNLSKNILKLIKYNDFENLTIKEIQEETGIDHPQKLYNRLEKLIREGYISEDYEILKMPEENKAFLPFYGWAQCGNNGAKISEEYPRERIEIDLEKNNLKNKNYGRYFITRAKGKSMEPKIKTGTDLLIELSPFLGGNDFYLVQHNQKPKIKQITKKKGKYFLHSINKDYPDLEIKDDDVFDVIGIVKERDLII
ncbi:MAG: S24 family peptidase, partial [Candidatus Gracilibacteria bacterium]|nr:S24 family peptidase [Candidatus Gracilibacteria bacterium]